MDDVIYRKDAVREIANHLGVPAENWIKIAEEWLRDVPSAQPDVPDTNVGDCISRQDALGYIDRVLTIGTGKHKSLEFIRKYIEALPPAQPETAKRTAETLQNVTDSDLISRKAAIDVIANQSTMSPHDRVIAVDTLVALPSAEPEEIALHESCTDCPLYDKDRHSCPRFNKVIPETLREVMVERRQDGQTN